MSPPDADPPESSEPSVTPPPAAPPGPGAGVRSAAWVGAAIGASVAIVALGPAAARVWNPSPDAAEYLDAGRRAERGEGLVTGIKVYYIDAPGEAPPQPEPIARTRAPLLPALIGVAVRLGGDGPGLQMIGVLAAAATAAAAAALGTAARAATAPATSEPAGDDRGGAAAGIVAGVAVATLPALGATAVHLWAEPLAAAAIGWALVLAAVRRGAAPSLSRAIGAGSLAGLAALARPEAVLAVPAVIAVAALAGPRGGRLRAAASPLAGAGPILLVGLLARGGGASPQSFLLAVRSFHDVTWHGYAEPPGTALGLLADDPAFVIGGAFANLGHSLLALFDPRHAGLIGPAAVAGVVLGIRRRAPTEGAPTEGGRIALLAPVIVALLLVAALAAPASTRDPRRFTAVALTLLAPAAAAGVVGVVGRIAARRRGAAIALAIVLAITQTVLVVPAIAKRIRRAARRAAAGEVHDRGTDGPWANPDLDRLVDALGEAPVAATHPWSIAWRTRARAVLLPVDLDADHLERLLDELAVTRVVLDRRGAEARGGHAELAEPLHYERLLSERGRIAAARDLGRYRMLDLLPKPE